MTNENDQLPPKRPRTRKTVIVEGFSTRVATGAALLRYTIFNELLNEKSPELNELRDSVMDFIQIIYYISPEKIDQLKRIFGDEFSPERMPDAIFACISTQVVIAALIMDLAIHYRVLEIENIASFSVEHPIVNPILNFLNKKYPSPKKPMFLRALEEVVYFINKAMKWPHLLPTETKDILKIDWYNDFHRYFFMMYKEILPESYPFKPMDEVFSLFILKYTGSGSERNMTNNIISIVKIKSFPRLRRYR
ncbi:MAG: hypothetical protein ACM3SY_08375 [Candidatus Omnitrophota bacterium]